ncbi:MAG: DMT family transporter, partial [Sphingomonadaceae bacterium]|nr:DMT family transporter [Sphingomonadaceae bacterium]
MYQSERPIFAITARIVGALFVATLLMLVKYAGERGIAIPEIIFWRQAVTIPIVLVVLGGSGNLHRLKTRRLPSHAIRACLSIIGMGATFAAAILLTLPQASVLSFTSPFFAVLLSVLILGESAGPWRWAAVILGFCGVLVMAQPGGGEIAPLGAIAGLTGAFMIVIVSYQLKDLAHTDSPIACVFYLALFASLIM